MDALTPYTVFMLQHVRCCGAKCYISVEAVSNSSSSIVVNNVFLRRNATAASNYAWL